MRKPIIILSIFLVLIFLSSCSKQGNFSGVYEVSNGIYTDTEEWVLAKDGTAVGSTSDGKIFTFEWSVQNDTLYISQLYGSKGEVEYYGKLTKGDKYTVFDMQTATTTLRKSLTRKADAPNSAYNEFPDEDMLIGYYICGDTEYSFSKDGQFTYSGPADKFTCSYSVIGNRINLQLGSATFYRADGDFFLSVSLLNNLKYEFSFDVSKDGLTVFSNHRDYSYRLTDKDIFTVSSLERTSQLKDTDFSEAARDTILSKNVYWVSNSDSKYHTHSDCSELSYYNGNISSGTFIEYVNIFSTNSNPCKICAGRDATSDGIPDGETNTSVNELVTAPELVETAKTMQDYTINPATGMAKEIKSVDDNYLILVNRTHPLAEGYIPNDMVKVNSVISGVGVPGETDMMRRTAAEAFEKMVAAAKNDGIEILMRTGYRSYSYQRDRLYQPYITNYGQTYADTISAKPGQSEHQTGLACDIGGMSEGYALSYDFGNTNEGKWVAAHSYEYGFIIRYTDGTREKPGEITGFIYEPWHLRYVGVEAATYMHKNGLLLEECLGIVD